MSGSRRLLFFCLFFISGACGLIYEIVWSRLLVFVFGGTTFAITTVLACFMGGLALGSYLAGRLSHRTRRPARLYGLLEIGVGLYCLLIPLLLDLALPLYRAIAESSGGSFFWLTVGRVLVCSMILIIPTAFMGATLPLLSKAFVRRSEELGSAIGRLYGINTIGAFAGCAGAGFFLLPVLGLSSSILLAALLNISAGITAFLLAGKAAAAGEGPDIHRATELPAAGLTAAEYVPGIRPAVLLLLYGLSGFAAMAYQVAWTRALILSMGASTYAFSAIVACFILGIALGSLLIAPWVSRVRAPLALAGVLEGVIGLSTLLVVPLFGEMPGLVKQLSGSIGATFEHVLTIEILCVAGLLAVPTICMGALLPLVCAVYEAARRQQRRAEPRAAGDARTPSAGQTVGAVYASNTLGTILGTAVAGFALIPWPLVGMQRTIMLASALSLIIATAFVLSEMSWRRAATVAGIAAAWLAAVGMAAVSAPWSKAVMISGPYLGQSREEERSEVLFYREGIDTTVAVTSTERRIRCLLVNGKPDASTGLADMRTQLLLGHIPMLVKPDATDVCVIGLGSGVTTGAFLAHPVQRVDVVEISSAVVSAAQYFSQASNNAHEDPRFHLHRADGRNFLLIGDRKYDVIISEPSNPWISGIANLFSTEFFEIARGRLKPGGIHCQWFHAYSMKADDFAAVIATMAAVFKHVQLWEMSYNDYLAVCSDEPLTLDVEDMHLMFRLPIVNMTLAFVMINEPLQLAHHYVADARALASWIAAQEPLTDDLPRLEFSAPRYLLRGERVPIVTALCEAGATPALAGDPTSPLNAEFARRVQDARVARRHLAAAQQSGSPELQLDLLRRAAFHAPHDARALIEINRLLKNALRTASIPAAVKIENLYMEISGVAPWIADMRAEKSVKRHEQLWPLGKMLTPNQQRQRMSMTQTATALLDAGDAAQAETAAGYLLKAWITRPADPEMNYKLACAYCLAGQHDRAVTFLEAAIETGFEDRDRLESSAILRGLRDHERFQQLRSRIGRAP